MNLLKTIQRPVIYITAAALLGACATTEGPGGSKQQGAANEDPCSVGSSALAGALAGALLGALVDGKNGALRGGAIGAGVGALACVAINVNSRQTKTAAQAEQDYLRTSKALPKEPTVTAYNTQLQSSAVKRGQSLLDSSARELVNGRNQAVNEVKEDLIVCNPDGTPFKTGSKPFTANSAGRFENSFELKLPEGAHQGAYALKTNVYVNGKMLATRDLRTQVVWNGSTGVVVAAL